MSPSKLDELRGLESEELLERLKEVERDLFINEAKRLLGAAEKTHLRRALKKERARILTILRERGIKL
ncbi:50S ribosomal protein L29 [Candidatus Korarchaeum cryptofilum]|jgi:ribosomal protein L29|uniref:Large ribosomal subunit protein uL29 n=1 Tax=Candidatus Korarchaeum cryptofilum TaxID=498846 RepID=A0A3R9QR98_9CREN|nr:50S ribosomal protein L29 [Candidatus Korarchaeum cryptofilum]RSN69579.1 50S ribosomal protein L29 [Candidatus Korarchaeum cryptofilum]